MSNFIYEWTLKDGSVAEADIWGSLIADGLADGEGELNYDAISRLEGIDIPDGMDGIDSSDGADSLCGEGTAGAVIGTDTRTKVDNTDVAPYKSVVLLIMKYGDKQYRGTGFLIKNNVVLTAAHNIYSQKEEKPADEVYVIAAQKDAAHIRCCSGIKVSVDYVAKTSQDGHYDWGLIKMNAPMADLGVINILKAEDVSVEEFNNALISGYPAEVKAASTTDMWEADGALDSYDAVSKILKYKISTSGGNSGSPVMVNVGRSITAIGIHVMGSVVTNTAKAIDDEVISAINAFN